jgi:hypothetical protein
MVLLWDDTVLLWIIWFYYWKNMGLPSEQYGFTMDNMVLLWDKYVFTVG